jgi:hypothetical protein
MVRAADGDRDVVLELVTGDGRVHREALPGDAASERSAQCTAFTCGRASERRRDAATGAR